MKNIQKNNKGFTLLEIIIVIIIIGVLASLALPRFLKTVEYSRSAEAVSHLAALRGAMDRCYLFANTYVGCDNLAALDVDDPGALPNAHFGYTFPAAATQTTYTVLATRNSFEGGNPADTVTIDQAGAKSGTTQYSGIR